MRLSQDFHIKTSCGIDYIYVPAFTPSGYPIQGTVVSFNETGKYLWENLQPMESFTLQQAAELLQKEYEIDDQTALEDCKATLREWARMRLLLKE